MSVTDGSTDCRTAKAMLQYVAWTKSVLLSASCIHTYYEMVNVKNVPAGGMDKKNRNCSLYDLGLYNNSRKKSSLSGASSEIPEQTVLSSYVYIQAWSLTYAVT